MTENSTFGTTTSARVMIEAGHSKDFAYICFTFPEEPNKAVMAINRRIVLTKPPYVAMVQSKEEHQALFIKSYMERMVVMRAGGNPILNSHKAAAILANNFMPILSQL